MRAVREERGQRPLSHNLLSICSWMATRTTLMLSIALSMEVTSVRSKAFSAVVQVTVEVEIFLA